MENKKTGLETAALYSFGCRGSKALGADPILARFIRNGGKGNEQKVRQLLKKLKSFPSYQGIAAQKGVGDPFEMARFYWLGSKPTDLQLGAPFCHNYSVLMPWAGVKIPKSLLKAMNLCIISWGRVKRISDHSLMVDSFVLTTKKKNEERLLPTTKTIIIDKGFIKDEDVVVDNWITHHYKIGREVVSSESADWLRLATEESLDIFNQKAKA